MSKVLQDEELSRHDTVHKKQRTLLSKIWYYKYLYLLLLPAVIYYVVFSYGPMYGIQLAFKQFMYNKGIWGSPWIGLDNFRQAFHSSDFFRALINTIVISIGRLVFTFPVPIILALLLNEIRIVYFKRVIQTVLYLPHFISWVIIAGILYSLLTAQGGLVNKNLEWFGYKPINFLLEGRYFKPIVFLSSIWKEAGWETIIYLAAIAGINPELYEAATIDGAGRFKKCLCVTWPGIKSTVVILFILSSGAMMYAGFDQIFNLMQSASLYNAGDIIDTYLYRATLLEGHFSYGTAVGLFQSVVNLFFLICINKVAKMVDEGQGLY